MGMMGGRPGAAAGAGPGTAFPATFCLASRPGPETYGDGLIAAGAEAVGLLPKEDVFGVWEMTAGEGVAGAGACGLNTGVDAFAAYEAAAGEGAAGDGVLGLGPGAGLGTARRAGDSCRAGDLSAAGRWVVGLVGAGSVGVRGTGTPPLITSDMEADDTSRPTNEHTA